MKVYDGSEFVSGQAYVDRFECLRVYLLGRSWWFRSWEGDGKRAVVCFEYPFDCRCFVVSSFAGRVQGEGEKLLVRLEYIVPVVGPSLRDKP